MKAKTYSFVLSTAFFLSAAASLSAANQAAQQPTVQDISVKNEHHVYGAKNPARFEKRNAFFDVEFLYWTAFEDGLEYVDQVTGNASGLTIQNFSAKQREAKFRANPGFRVGIGYEIGSHDQWDLSFYWTRYQTTASDRTQGETRGPIALIPIDSNVISNSGPFGIPTDAKAHLNLHMNLLDLDLGRDYFISKALALHPFVGLRGGWINQTYNLRYTSSIPLNGQNPFNQVVESTLSTSWKGKSRFATIGLRAGTDLVFYFSPHFGLYAKASGSLLYGRFRVTESTKGAQLVQGPSVGVSTFQVNAQRQFHRVRTNLEGALGLQWEQGFQKDRYYLTLGVGYEISEWFNQNQFAQVNRRITLPGSAGQLTIYEEQTTKMSGGDLGFHGLNVSLRFDF